jgi:hypothetical protein
MSKLRDNITAQIDAAVQAADPDIRITDLRLLLMRTIRLAGPPESHLRLWEEETHKYVQRLLKDRKEARNPTLSLFSHHPQNSKDHG